MHGGRLRLPRLSRYSHADAAAARQVQARLEGFPIGRDLAGRATATGIVPAQLRPVFRDRNDFDAGASLGAQMIASLDASAALVLIAFSRGGKREEIAWQ